MLQVFLVIFMHALLAMLLGWGYFDRYSIKRPPLGVLNLWDISFMMGSILLIPYLYLALPTWAVAGLLGLTASSLVYFCFEPILARPGLLWLVAFFFTGGDVPLLAFFGPTSPQFLAFNNLLQMIAVVSITNLWAQSGLKARDAAILGGGLALYDYTFTSMLPLMDNLFTRLDSLPFAPLVAWSLEDGQWGAIGLGDLLLATVFPLVMRKAYGNSAGWMALSLAAGAIAGLMLLFLTGLWQASFPVMLVLGPLLGGQYLFWRWRAGVERTMYQYLNTEPI